MEGEVKMRREGIKNSGHVTTEHSAKMLFPRVSAAGRRPSPVLPTVDQDLSFDRELVLVLTLPFVWKVHAGALNPFVKI